MVLRKERRTSVARLVIWIVVMLAIGIVIGSLLTSQSCKSKRKSSLSPVSEGQDLLYTATKEDDDSQYSQNETETVSDSDDRVEPLMPEATLPMVAIIIDDLGYAPPDAVVRLCKQSIDFDVAVLPHQEFTRQSAEIAHSRGKEVMLHLPMEPNGYPGPGKNPGPHAIMHDLSEQEVRRLVKKAIAVIPFVSGVNNHMGSRITQDYSRMTWILEEVKAKRCFFVDSLTEKKSVAFDIAINLSIPSAKREFFLDDDKDPVAIAKQWERMITLARSKGHAIAIGHMCPQTLDALERLIPLSIGKVRFVRVSRVIKGY
jgi:hypothetical protein